MGHPARWFSDGKNGLAIWTSGGIFGKEENKASNLGNTINIIPTNSVIVREIIIIG